MALIKLIHLQSPSSKFLFFSKKLKLLKKLQKKKVEKKKIPKHTQLRSKIVPFGRIWSENDELTVLEARLKWSRKHGKNGNDRVYTKDLDEIYGFARRSLENTDITSDQLREKMKKLKLRYRNNSKKGKNGLSLKLHKAKCYELMKMIWAGSEVSRRRSKPAPAASTSNGKQNNVDVAHISDEELMEEVQKRNLNVFAHTRFPPYSSVSKNLPIVAGLSKEVLCLLGDTKAKEFEQKWKEIYAAEAKNYEKHADLLQETLELMKASKDT